MPPLRGIAGPGATARSLARQRSGRGLGLALRAVRTCCGPRCSGAVRRAGPRDSPIYVTTVAAIVADCWKAHKAHMECECAPLRFCGLFFFASQKSWSQRLRRCCLCIAAKRRSFSRSSRSEAVFLDTSSQQTADSSERLAMRCPLRGGVYFLGRKPPLCIRRTGACP